MSSFPLNWAAGSRWSRYRHKCGASSIRAFFHARAVAICLAGGVCWLACSLDSSPLAAVQMTAWPFYLGQHYSVGHSRSPKLISSLNAPHGSSLFLNSRPSPFSCPAARKGHTSACMWFMICSSYCSYASQHNYQRSLISAVMYVWILFCAQRSLLYYFALELTGFNSFWGCWVFMALGLLWLHCSFLYWHDNIDTFRSLVFH